MDARLIALAMIRGRLRLSLARLPHEQVHRQALRPRWLNESARPPRPIRRDLARDWLGQEMPNWSQPCPITAQVGDQLGAGQRELAFTSSTARSMAGG